MFNLLPFVLSIILAGTLLVSVIFFGGVIYFEGSSQAKATGIVSEGREIIKAIQKYKFFEMEYPSDLVTQVLNNPKYHTEYDLSKLSSGEWKIGPSGIKGVGLKLEGDEEEAICKAVNNQLGYSGPIPICGALPEDIPYSSPYYCCLGEF